MVMNVVYIFFKIKTNFESTLKKNKIIRESLDPKYLTDIWIHFFVYATHLCYVKNVCQFSARIIDRDPIFLYIQKCTCTCTEEHEIKYEYHDENK